MLGLLVLAACGQSAATVQAASNNGAVAAPQAMVDDAEYVYVCNQAAATVSVIDVETLEVVGTVDLAQFGFDKNAKPHHIAVESDGAHWYVSLIGANRVLKFNKANELMGTAEFEAPGMLAMHPDEDVLFVGRSMMAVNPPQRIGMIETEDMDIEELDVFFPRPHALIVEPRGKFVYSGSLAVNQFLSMNIETGETNLERLDGEMTHTLVQFAITPDGSRMVVGGQMTGEAFIFDTSNPEDVKLLKTVKVNGAPWHPVISADGRFAYFGNKQTDTVTVLDIEKGEVADGISGKGLSQPHGSALSKDGKKLFISNNNLNGGYMAMDHSKMDHSNMDHSKMNEEKENVVGTLVVIDTESREIEKIIELGFYPSGVGTNLH